MIYSIFIKKMQGDIKPFNIVVVLRNYLKNNNNIFLLGWPGYISTSSSMIDTFKNEITSNNINVKGYFFNALNGHTTIQHPITHNPISRIDYMNEVFGGYTCTHKVLNDHSKIIALIEFKDNNLINDITLPLKNGYYEVKALLVGSSNQSYNTYINSPTPKVEADVFMFETENLKDEDEYLLITNMLDSSNDKSIDIFNEDYLNNVIVTKEVVSFKKSSSLKQIVKKLLKDIL